MPPLPLSFVYAAAHPALEPVRVRPRSYPHLLRAACDAFPDSDRLFVNWGQWKSAFDDPAVAALGSFRPEMKVTLGKRDGSAVEATVLAVMQVPLHVVVAVPRGMRDGSAVRIALHGFASRHGATLAALGNAEARWRLLDGETQ